MLSDDDKAQIEAEETAKLAVLREQQAEMARRKALEEYRESVKTSLTTAPHRSRFVIPLVLLSVVGTVAALLILTQPRASPVPDDSSGGISSSLLIERCVNAVRGRIGDLAWTFPTPVESASQISSSADGKRWDGWATPRVQQGEEDAKTQFSCQYTPATDSITTEIIKP